MQILDFMKPVALLLFAILLSSIVIARREREMDWLGPVFIFGICVFCGYLIPLKVFVDGIDLFSLRYGIDVSNPSSISHALVLASISVVAFLLGYLFVYRRRARPAEPEPPSRWSHRRFAFAAVIVATLAALLFGLGVAMLGGIAELFNGLGDRIRLFEGKNYFFQPVVSFLSVALVWYIRQCRSGGRRLQRLAFYLFFAVSLSLVGLLGNKSTLLATFIAVAIIHNRSRVKVSFGKVLAGASAAIVGLTTYAIFTREYLVTGALQSIERLDVANLTTAVQVELGGNFIQLQTLSFLIDGMGQRLDWQLGKTPLSLLTMPVPRSIWPDKPLPATGPFTSAFFPGLYEGSGTTIPPGIIGEMYMNFGSVGVVVGMFLFGTLYGRVAARLRQRQDDESLLAYALLVALLPLYIRGESVSVTVTFLLIFVPAVAIIRFSKSKAAFEESGMQRPPATGMVSCWGKECRRSPEQW